MHCKQWNTNQCLWTADSQTMIDRITVDIWWLSAGESRFFGKMSSTKFLAILGRLTPDYHATFGRYQDGNSTKITADCRSIIGWPSYYASLMTKPMKIGGSDETLNLVASTKKSSPSQRNRKNLSKRRPTIDRQSPDFPNFFFHRPLDECQFG